MIDAVYTWVDGSDPHWLQKKNATLAAMASSAQRLNRSALSDARFCNRDELKYSLRSLEKFAGFINRIYIVTDRQVPCWLNASHPSIELVSHQDIFPESSDLPTFNSHSIEANLHRIKGLSEQFIYLNDDFIFYDHVAESNFFDADGRAIVYFDRRRVHRHSWWFGYTTPVNVAARNNSRLLTALSYPPIRHRLDHVPYALNRSVIEELWSTFPGELRNTSAHRFRHPEDFSVVSSLAQHYALATNRAVSGPLSTNHYIKVKKYPLSAPLLSFRLSRLRRSQKRCRKFLSINDAGPFDHSELTQRAIARFFEATYPHQSRFEAWQERRRPA